MYLLKIFTHANHKGHECANMDTNMDNNMEDKEEKKEKIIIKI